MKLNSMKTCLKSHLESESCSLNFGGKVEDLFTFTSVLNFNTTSSHNQGIHLLQSPLLYSRVHMSL